MRTIQRLGDFLFGFVELEFKQSVPRVSALSSCCFGEREK